MGVGHAGPLRGTDSPLLRFHTGTASFIDRPTPLVTLRKLPLILPLKPRAGAAQIASEKQAEESRKFFELIREKERERMKKVQQQALEAEEQNEREGVLADEWVKFLDRIRWKSKGRYWDPQPGHDILFSDFASLLDSNQVQFMEYGDAGQNVSVILPYSAEDGSRIAPHDLEQMKDRNKTLFKYHKVRVMPADGWNDIWRKLHKQLVYVDFINTKAFAAQVYPTLGVVVVWLMRLALAYGIYKWIDSKLYPIYRLRDPNDRPKIKRLKLLGGDGYLGSLGQSRARFISAEESTGVTFDDFAGQEYVKRELLEVVKILKGSADFTGLGVYCPKGVLLYGPPGTGKTLLAKAIAGEAGVPFFSASGSEFVEMFVGVAAARVRDLFTRARQFAPSIIFIDEIDAIGAKRGGPDVGGGGVEREQGLVQILTELDGFQTTDAQVLVVGATNRLDMLDPALLRKGRFDKVLGVGLPTEEGRLAILRVHAKNKGWRSESEREQLLKETATLTPDFSGAELQNILNEASILAARKDKDLIEREEIQEALKRQEGQFKTGEEEDIEVSPEAKIRVAYREAAVAVLECYFPNMHKPFLKTTIRFLDTTPNMTYRRPRGHVYVKKSELVNSVIRVCAPRVIEELIFGKDNISWISGACLEEAGVLTDYIILQSGMTALGKIHYETDRDLVTHLGPKVQALRDEYMRYCLEKCSAVLKEYRSAVETFADVLLEKVDIDAEEIWAIFNKAPRIPQVEPRPIDEYAALVYVGRWGIYGASLPGRVTFKPGYNGFATFGAPRPMHTRIIDDRFWKMMDDYRIKRFQSKEQQQTAEVEMPELVSSDHFL